MHTKIFNEAITRRVVAESGMNKLHPTMPAPGTSLLPRLYAGWAAGAARTACMMGLYTFQCDTGQWTCLLSAVCCLLSGCLLSGCLLSVSVSAPITGPHVLAAGAPLVNCHQPSTTAPRHRPHCACAATSHGGGGKLAAPRHPHHRNHGQQIGIWG